MSMLKIMFLLHGWGSESFNILCSWACDSAGEDSCSRLQLILPVNRLGEGMSGVWTGAPNSIPNYLNYAGGGNTTILRCKNC